MSVQKQFQQVGASAVGYHLAEVYDTELMGLTVGLNNAISYANQHPEVKHIYMPTTCPLLLPKCSHLA
ncbi:hypothetical protein P691DRAFT_801280 [Macrolepiota fuliginosa MF-IS2]|uniref:Uncharacterized protein n=1 Tax=Macrolepiota fuliginosa MF-IS2 TaxID=1400762 RepID=A0A9P5WXE2_9AGAR|nr:hypothetical protein P691DRAFT_801280 [Macrolepiota fuliginosa MF-IS2]